MRTGLLSRFAACLALGVWGLSHAQVVGQQQIMPNYREADIRQIIEAVGAVTGRNFLVDPRVRAQVTLLSYSPMTPDAFYEAFLATLAVHGYAALDAGDVVKIIPDANARYIPTEGANATGDEIVTQTVTLQNIAAAQLVPILRPLIPQYGHLAAHQTSNMLIIADRASNVTRMLNIIASMDRTASEDIEVIRLENASANEVVRMLSALSQANAAAGGAPPAQIAADERTNSVLISGSENNRLRYRALVAHLDSPSEIGGDTRVRYLNYADAESLATNLQAQFGAAAVTGEGEATEGVNIWADTGTNSLVISATAATLQDMTALIDKLDIPRAQVKVDAIIVEVREDRTGQLGITWALEGAQSNDGVALTNFGSTAPGIAQLATAGASGNADPSLLPDGVSFAIGQLRDSGTSWAALLTALQGDATTNIIATPTIVTLDNAEAEIRVGQEVPFLTGQFTNTGANQGAVNPFQTIQREEVGTRLRITPQINEGSGVKLDIEQESSSISQGASGAVDLITNSRTITTSVFVQDREILVLGGLIDDQLTESEQRVPFLGRVPGLGWLFRARSTERGKTNLMVFIRPTILRDTIQASFETNTKYNYIRDLQLQQAEEPIRLMRDVERPLLPPNVTPPAPETTAPDASTEETDGTEEPDGN
jgi:general secretion pathway protein D